MPARSAAHAAVALSWRKGAEAILDEARRANAKLRLMTVVDEHYASGPVYVGSLGYRALPGPRVPAPGASD